MNRLASGIFEIFLVLATAASFNLVMTPPHAAVPMDQLAKQTLTDRTARQQALLQRIFVGGVSLLHVVTLVASFVGTEGHVTHTIPNMFIVATAICLACASLRFWAFATLGQLFDFQVRIQADHKLVTEGPYSYVRHPSYAGLFLMYIGIVMELFSPGHWLRDYGLKSKIGQGVCCLWGLQAIVMLCGLWKRLDMEDEILRRRFGKDWDEWARRVPFRLIPGIY